MSAEPFTLENATPADLARETRAKADRAEIAGRPAWSYIFDCDLEHPQQELAL